MLSGGEADGIEEEAAQVESDGHQSEKQKLSARNAKIRRKLSPERMRIVIEVLSEYPILYVAAAKAGIHRKALEYWLKCSEAGQDGYDIEWEGLPWRFHEACGVAIDEADQTSIREKELSRGGGALLLLSAPRAELVRFERLKPRPAPGAAKRELRDYCERGVDQKCFTHSEKLDR